MRFITKPSPTARAQRIDPLASWFWDSTHKLKPHQARWKESTKNQSKSDVLALNREPQYPRNVTDPKLRKSLYRVREHQWCRGWWYHQHCCEYTAVSITLSQLLGFLPLSLSPDSTLNINTSTPDGCQMKKSYYSSLNSVACPPVVTLVLTLTALLTPQLKPLSKANQNSAYFPLSCKQKISVSL